MESYVLKRYQVERGNSLGTFYQKENLEDYARFKNELYLSSVFFKTLTEDYLNDAFYLYELASSKDTSVSQHIEGVKQLVEVEPFYEWQGETPWLSKERCDNEKTGCLVAQGVYPSLTIYLNEFLEQGTFAIGVVGKKHTESFKTQVKFYKQMHQQLLYRGIPLNPPIRKSNSRFGSYILTKKV